MKIVSKINEIVASPGLPGRVTAERAATVLGFALHDIPILVRRGLLRPLGTPVPNSVKYFAACEILELSTDRAWLNRATKAVADNWKGKNQKVKHKPATPEVAVAFQNEVE